MDILRCRLLWALGLNNGQQMMENIGDTSAASDLEGLAAPEEPAASINSFPRGSVAEGLERLHARLLDLTNRNRLLNYRHPRASSLRVVNSDLQSVFNRLVSGAKLPFEPVPEPTPREIAHLYSDEEDTSSLAKPPAQEFAAAIGRNTSGAMKGLMELCRLSAPRTRTRSPGTRPVSPHLAESSA
jgi:Protein of unknown function (DUF4011)